MTDRQAFPAASGTARQDSQRSRCHPARKVLGAILGRTGPALAAAAILVSGARDLAAQVIEEEPKVTIAAERSAYGFGIDDVVFTLSRSGPKDVAFSVGVTLGQDDSYLAVGQLSRTVQIAADQTDAELRIPAQVFNGPASESGALSAALVNGPGYMTGRPNSARTRMVVKDPAITVRPEQASYTVDRSDGAVRITFVARTAPDLPRPGKAFSISVSSKADSDETAARNEARAPSRTIDFKPGNFVSQGGEWEARKSITFSMIEVDEGLDVMFKRAPSTPERIRPRNSDGTPCANDVCMVPVIMTQSEEPTLTIAAGSDSYGYEIDDVVFTITREGMTDSEITGSVTMTQEDTFLPSGSLQWTFAIAQGQTTATHTILAPRFAGGATQSGNLTATLDAGDGYAVGTPDAATVRMVVLDTAITVRPEKASYRFLEGDTAAKVAFVARTEPGLPQPNTSFRVTVSTSGRDDGADSPDDFAPLSELTIFKPDNFIADGQEWMARMEFALEIHNDGEVEDDEIFDMLLEKSPGLSTRIKLRQADGSACDGDCKTPVTIGDNPAPQANGLAIAPVPPQASADHGPYYTKDEFLALPHGAVHGPGAVLTFTLTLDEAVTVTGRPELVLDIWDRERRARYSGGSGTPQLRFTWRVAKGDNDPDGLEFRSLDLNGGTVRDGEGHDFLPETLAPQRFAEHRVRGGLFAMRLEAPGSAREGEPFAIRVVRNGGYDEVAVAGVHVGDSALPHILPGDHYAENGPGIRQFDFDDGEPSEPGVRVSTRTVTPPGDGVADASRTLTVRLAGTDAGFQSTSPLGDYRAWYLTEEPLEVTVPVIDTGQPLAMAGLRVHGASAREAPDAKLVFRVTLSPHSEAPVTVDYRTGDDPYNSPQAVAGSDYVAALGRLTLAPGETEKTVEVQVMEDDHDEPFETLRLYLENAQGARIDRPNALGIIKNDGPIPKAWIGRFGRTVAEQVLDAVESRMQAARQPGVEMTLAGQRVGGQSPQDESGAARDPARWERVGFDALESRGATAHDLLGGTSFAVTAESGRGGYATLWGRGAVTRFDGSEGDLTLDGEVTSAMVGVDWARDDWTAGLIASRSVGEGGYDGNSSGRIEVTLTGLYPWGRLALSERTDAWGAAGYGTGELSVTPKKPGTEEDGATVRTDLDLRMAAAGLRGELLDGAEEGLALTAKTDALIVRTASDAARGSDGGNLAAARATVTRLRLGLEGSQPISLEGGSILTPSAEVGVRHDGGDAETGFGIDFGGGIAWSDPKSGLSAELRGHALLTHEAEGFRERGVSGSVTWDSRPSSALGPAATLTQTVGGSAEGGADALLAQGALTGLAARPGSGSEGDGDLQHRRLEARFGYGFPAWGGRFASVPEVGLGLSDTGREYILGWRLADNVSGGAGIFQLSTEARRVESAVGSGPAENRIGVLLLARW